MPGGLMQLVGKGAQDQLVTGNPSFTHFRSMYKRHSEFAMEHFKLVFRSTQQNIPPSGSVTLRAKVERFAQLLHDCYIVVTMPDIYSPVYPVSGLHPNLNVNSNAIGYQFQWIKNLGYNMINYVAILINGQEVARHTGEWMKLYASLKFDANKKEILDRMVGNVKEMYDPANAYDRVNQYPNAISSATDPAEPSIPGRNLHIPLHFWFCENVGAALPLVALQHSEIEIVVDFKNMYQLFTTLDVRETVGGVANPTFGTRIAPDTSSNLFFINNFLSPPLYDRTGSIPAVETPGLNAWNLNPFIEANYIWLSDAEMVHVAKSEHSFIFPQVDVVSTMGQYGPSNDLELTMRNLATRVVWVGQRSDLALNNDCDNYTNWENTNEPPLDSTSIFNMTPWYSSGTSQSTSVSARDILLNSTILIDGKERFTTKGTDFFSQMQPYRHQTGRALTTIPGIYSYSFALDHGTHQPSGHINGSMFNKTILRNTYVQPPTVSPNAVLSVCILKSTAFSPNPTVVANPNIVDPKTNKPLYNPEDLVRVVTKSNAATLQYSFNVRAFVESYNFLRVMGGVASVVFSS
jgi:hypothetical protein